MREGSRRRTHQCRRSSSASRREGSGRPWWSSWCRLRTSAVERVGSARWLGGQDKFDEPQVKKDRGALWNRRLDWREAKLGERTYEISEKCGVGCDVVREGKSLATRSNGENHSQGVAAGLDFPLVALGCGSLRRRSARYDNFNHRPRSGPGHEGFSRHHVGALCHCGKSCSAGGGALRANRRTAEQKLFYRPSCVTLRYHPRSRQGQTGKTQGCSVALRSAERVASIALSLALECRRWAWSSSTRGTRCPEYTEHKERMSTVEAASSWVTG